MGIHKCGLLVLFALSYSVVQVRDLSLGKIQINLGLPQISSKFEFTNIRCNSLDKQYSDFEHCLIKSINRSYKYVTIRVKLFKTPLTKVKGRILKRFDGYNGYRPFMVNMTVDACRFLENMNSNPIANYLYGFVKLYTNMNHSCPYDHDLLVDKLPIQFVNYQVTKVLPFPEGDYVYETHWFAYDIKRAVVKVYGTIS
ncbi:uncharacterized protein LOC6538960 [Drosophila yakuba]|uniref:Drosophila melanogaster n=1 Tax=Drosophila yakuba TaxID=7245 RepID=B4PMP1_DROYA|nr:uncharacterized protein LOC6538960 [Drosophila yakuba]EDW99175.2 uncharacterized protein Dyak_GE23342 [Drosophila yakuba]